jgi:DNA-binding beta-propeller fold protein YncE
VYISVPGRSGGQDYIAIVESESMQQVYVIQQCGTTFAVAPNGNIWSLCLGSSLISEVSGENFSVIGTFASNSVPDGIAVSPDGSQVFVNEAFPIGFQVISPATGSSTFIQTDLDFGQTDGVVFRPVYLQ